MNISWSAKDWLNAKPSGGRTINATTVTLNLDEHGDLSGLVLVNEETVSKIMDGQGEDVAKFNGHQNAQR